MVTDSDEVVKLTKKLVNIKSEIPQYGEAGKDIEKSMAEAISGYLADSGIKAEVPEVEKGRYNVIAEIGQGERLMLNGHMDTVPMADPSQWRHGRTYCNTVNGKLYGLGTADMKGGLAAMLVAVSRINLKNPKRGLLLTFVADEEGDFKGSNWLFANKPDIFKNVKYGIIGEATDMRIQTGQKGLVGITIKFMGKSAHASTPEKGINAISKAAGFMACLEDFKKSTKGRAMLSQGNTLSIGTIAGGRSQNTVPDSCTLGIDMRVVYGFTAAAAVRTINDLLRKASFGKKDADVTVNYSKNAFTLAENAKIVNMLKNATGQQKTICGSGYTEAELYYSKTGIKCAVFGPGSKKAIHGPNEYVSVSDLKRAEKIYGKVVSDWCLN